MLHALHRSFPASKTDRMYLILILKQSLLFCSTSNAFVHFSWWQTNFNFHKGFLWISWMILKEPLICIYFDYHKTYNKKWSLRDQGLKACKCYFVLPRRIDKHSLKFTKLNVSWANHNSSTPWTFSLLGQRICLSLFFTS